MDRAADIVDLTGQRSYDRGVVAGQAIYRRLFLDWFYDAVVHGVSNPLIWRSTTRKLIALYDAHASANHLDVGVGTGYLLDRCRFPVADPQIALADLNPDALQAAHQRIRRYPRQTLYRWNALEPLAIDTKFDSVGLTYLLHCLPGTMATKAVVFTHLRDVMSPGAVLFGATILDDAFMKAYPPARALAAFYNRAGVFSNAGDSLAGLESALAAAFPGATVEVHGCVALFVARRP